MWTYLVRIILRNRLGNLIIIALLTAFMLYKAFDVQLSYQLAQMLPTTDSTYIKYNGFKEIFGEDGSVLFIGIQDENIYELNKFNDWYDLTCRVKDIEGVEEVVSIAKMYQLTKNEETKKFDFLPVISKKPYSQEELDSLKEVIYSLPFYDGLLYNKESNVTLMMITLDKAKLNTKGRIPLIKEIQEVAEDFGKWNNVKMHFSGLPYIRTITSKKVEDELKMFVLLALLVASIALFIFFKSFKAMMFPMIIVVISVIWSFGLVSLFGYKITMLTGIIPPLLIVIGVENCIFLLNKYHYEYKKHGNKVKALSRVVQRVGNAAFLTNMTTAIGFAAFIVTGNKILVEFGIIASINIMIVFFLSIFLIPIFYSYLDPPKRRHLNHLENKRTLRIVNTIVNIVNNRRNVVYVTTIVFVILGIIGVSRLKTTGNIVDDIPKKDPLYLDLMFMEKHFNGVMPFEISIDTRKKNGVMKLSNIRRIEKLQKVLDSYPDLSKPVSVAEVVKFAKQAYYNGDPSFYTLPNNNEITFMGSYIPKPNKNKKTILNSFIDTNLQVTRVSVQMKNIGTKDIKRIQEELKPRIDSIFNPKKFDTLMTGTSVVFLKGTQYMIKNLLTSLILALVAISLLMALLFTSPRMILVSLVPNLIPQLLTAALMGYLGIPIKPSTILIFSIALGISVDNAIHFLSRYRMELNLNNWNIKDSVMNALRETGFSMIYSSVVLFFGFAIFTFSSFGGTEAMGYLVSFTLLIAVLSNLFLLPSLLLTLDKRITTKLFKEPLLDIFDEEEDIELNHLEIEGYKDTRGSA